MTSTSFQIATIVLDEIFNGNFTVVSRAVSFASNISPVAQLSSPTTERSNYAGLLYTPTVASVCVDTQAVIPRNLSVADLPAAKNIVAFAPASNCRDQYLAQAVLDGARALVLYPPSSDTTPLIPPTSPSFSASIPVYMTSWANAEPIAEAMNLYNTDMLNVPYGQNLSEYFSNQDYVRLFISVSKNGSSSRSLPGLWIFLLIVLGLLCFIVVTTSIAMHTHQYLARRDLRRRIAAGEVDLEGLGIKRLTVPKKYVDALPLRNWLAKPIVGDKVETSTTAIAAGDHASYDQTSCAICLEDYETGVSVIRELPCKHIYHQDCIDPFLLRRSSLCPLCKQSVLPKGYLPPDSLLTSATVMRERRRRRQATRRAETDPSAAIEASQSDAVSMTNMSRPVANLADLAPDNEEESRLPRNGRLGRIKQFWRTLFPS